MIGLASYIGTSGPIIAENGAVIAKGWEILSVEGKRESILKATEFLKQRFPGKVRIRGNVIPRLIEESMARLFSAEEANILLAQEGYIARVVDTGFALHVTDPRINKGKALKTVSGIMKIPLTAFVAVGDGSNDVTLLSMAGYGVAVANAIPDLKRIADYVSRREYGSGFVEAIDYLYAKNLL